MTDSPRSTGAALVLRGAVLTVAAAAAWAAVPADLSAAGGVAVDGRDHARILPPAGARVETYANAGYRLRRDGQEVHVEVDATPLGSSAPFQLSGSTQHGEGPIQRLARAQTAGATTRYEAVDRILGWVSRHIEYRLERHEPQDARAVLERRSGYCTGVARLTVALLAAVGIEAREVAGYVVDDGSAAGIRGYHRWIEVYYPDRGWAFSDPFTHHHYVPATYVRLASNDLEAGHGLEGLLVERHDAVVLVDLHPAAAPGILARRNSNRRLAAALRVWLDGGARHGEAELEGMSRLYRQPLVDGEATFVGLAPGRYRVVLNVPGQGIFRHEVELPDRLAAELRLGDTNAAERSN